MSDEYSDAIHTLETFTEDGTSYSMYRANFVRKGKFLQGGEKGHECCICGTVYPDSQLMLSGGKYYCYPRGCYKDLSNEDKGKAK